MASASRILIVGGFAGSLVNFRGDLIQALLASGASVHAAAPKLTAESAAGRCLSAWGAEPHDVCLARTGMNPASDLRTTLDLYRLCRKVRPTHVLAYTSKPVIYGLPAARWAGAARTTALITGLGYAFTDAPRGARLALRGLIARLYRWALRSADRVIFQNPDDQALFLDLGLVEHARCGLINGSGVNLQAFRHVPLPPLGPELRFLLTARLIRHKGIYEFAEAARRVRQHHPEVQFDLVGGHDPNPAAIDRKDLGRWVADGTLNYHGEVTDVRPALARAHVFVLPSYYREGIPRTVLEAMAMGRPIITTDAPGCKETVVDGANGQLVPIRDPGALTEAMLRFIREPEQIETQGKASRQLAERKFDVVRVNRDLMAAMGL